MSAPVYRYILGRSLSPQKTSSEEIVQQADKMFMNGLTGNSKKVSQIKDSKMEAQNQPEIKNLLQNILQPTLEKWLELK